MLMMQMVRLDLLRRIINMHRNMIRHVLLDIAQKQRTDDTDTTKGDTDIIHRRVTFDVGDLTSSDNVFPFRGCVYAGEEADFIEEGGAG